MKKILALILAGLFIFAFAACSSDKSEAQDAGEQAAAELTDAAEDASGVSQKMEYDYGFSGTTFTFDGTDYDMSEGAELVNAVVDAVPAGKNIVVEGHINPHMNAYGIFDTEAREFVNYVYGTCFIWYDGDVATGVYADHADICAYDGTVIASLDMSEQEVVYAMAFSEDRSSVDVTILNDTDERIVQVPLG